MSMSHISYTCSYVYKAKESKRNIFKTLCPPFCFPIWPPPCVNISIYSFPNISARNRPNAATNAIISHKIHPYYNSVKNEKIPINYDVIWFNCQTHSSRLFSFLNLNRVCCWTLWYVVVRRRKGMGGVGASRSTALYVYFNFGQEGYPRVAMLGWNPRLRMARRALSPFDDSLMSTWHKEDGWEKRLRLIRKVNPLVETSSGWRLRRFRAKSLLLAYPAGIRADHPIKPQIWPKSR